MGFVENLVLVCFFCVAGCVLMALSAGLVALMRKFAPGWMRDSFFGSLFGLESDQDDADGVTAADVMEWNAHNIPANDK